jgi:hypothetical protein
MVYGLLNAAKMPYLFRGAAMKYAFGVLRSGLAVLGGALPLPGRLPI